MEDLQATDIRMLDELLIMTISGDRSALEALYRETKVAIYSFALSVLKHREDAEDVLHDVFLAIYGTNVSYRSHGKPMAYLITVTRNLCLMKLRERQKTVDFPEDFERREDGSEAVSTEDRLLLNQCMTILSDEERQIVVLHAVSGLKHREIAAELSLPLPTVLSKYRRAIHKLKEYCS